MKKTVFIFLLLCLVLVVFLFACQTQIEKKNAPIVEQDEVFVETEQGEVPIWIKINSKYTNDPDLMYEYRDGKMYLRNDSIFSILASN